MNSVVSSLLEDTKEKLLKWRKENPLEGEDERRFVVRMQTQYYLIKYSDGSIKLEWIDKDSMQSELRSQEATEINELWSSASGERALIQVKEVGDSDTPDERPYAYTRDYVKTCTAEIITNSYLSYPGVLVSTDGHILTCTRAIPASGPIKIRFRGALCSYLDQQEDGPLLPEDKLYTAEMVEEDRELVLLRVNGLVFSTPNLIPTIIKSTTGKVWSGFRWWLLERTMVEATIKAIDTDWIHLDDNAPTVDRRFPNAGAAGAPVLHSGTGFVIGLVIEERDAEGHLLVAPAHRILELTRKGGVAGSYPETRVFGDRIHPQSPHCRTYVERPEDEELRRNLLGNTTRYIRLTGPSMIGVDTLFKRFEFENIRFRFYQTSLKPFRDSKAHDLLWVIINDINAQTSQLFSPTRQKQLARAIVEFEKFVYKDLIRDTALIIVFHIDHIEAIIPNEEARNAFLDVLTRLFDRRNRKKDHARVRFAVSGHIGTEDDLATLATQEEMLKGIELRHFSKEETKELTNLLAMDGVTLDESAHDSVYEWTGGHCLLVHYVCRRLEELTEPDLADLNQNIDRFLSSYLVEDPDDIIRKLINGIRDALKGDFEAIKVFSNLCDNSLDRVPFKRGEDGYMRLYHLGLVKPDDTGENLILANKFFAKLQGSLIA